MWQLTLVILLFVSPCIPSSDWNDEWQIFSNAERDVSLQVKIGFVPQSLDKLQKIFSDSSNPLSPSFGKYLTREAINALIAPKPEDRQQVLDHLFRAGLPSNHSIQIFGDVMQFDLAVDSFEAIFKTEVFLFQHKKGKLAYSSIRPTVIPSELSSVVSFISFVGKPPQIPSKRTVKRQTVSAVESVVVPYVLQQLYLIPNASLSNPSSSVCVVTLASDGGFQQRDVDYFQKASLAPKSKIKLIGTPSGGVTGSLDVEYGVTMAPNATIYYWDDYGWLLHFTTDYYYLQDAPKILSIGWGWTESEQCLITNCNGLTGQQYVDQVNTQLLKIAARGTTILVSSGDQGAPGYSNSDCFETGAKTLNPTFPATSPYVTAIGLTALSSTLRGPITANPPICIELNCSTSKFETVATYPKSRITSGGGFSTYNSVPSWQTKAVSSYLSSSRIVLPPKSAGWNASNRAIPDVAAVGHSIAVRQDSQWEIGDGSAASLYSWVGVVAQINEHRFKKRKIKYWVFEPNFVHSGS